ncbi:MAG: D-alanine--D-alanine ligase [Clostridia bacterium]|nr:D-alanine--D-alanine ligase [Clostridia bacterium]
MKIKVGVFFGGKSVEHEISIISAVQAMLAMDTEKYEIVPIYITKQNQMYTGESLLKIEEYKDIPALLKKCKRVFIENIENKVTLLEYPLKRFGKNEINTLDVALPIVHGTNVEDGTLQGYFNFLNLPYCGCDVLASAVGMDKFFQKAVMKEAGVPVLTAKSFDMKAYNKKEKEILAEIEAEIAYPMIVKPVNLGSSVGIRKVHNREELVDAIDYGFEFSLHVIVEHAVSNLREINCSVLGDYEKARASECEEPVNADEILSYQDKYLNGEKNSSKGMSSTKRKLPADISEELKNHIQELALKSFSALKLSGVVRIDFLMDNETKEVWVNEVNTIPGSLAFYLWEATGLKFSELLDEMIRLALKRNREQENVTYSFDTNVLSGIKLGGAKGKL